MKAERIPAVCDYSLIAMLVKKSALLVLLILAAGIASGQIQPNLENGYKPYGSYDGNSIDTVNTMNGNLLLNIAAPFQYPQRGSLDPHYAFYLTSKNWMVQCIPNTDSPTGLDCHWAPGISAQCVTPLQNVHSNMLQVCAFPSGVNLTNKLAITVKRTAEKEYTGTGSIVYDAFGYSMVSWDLAVHHLYPIPGSTDANGRPTQFESIDGTGYHVQLSNPGSGGVNNSVVVTDRSGNLYQGTFPDPDSCVTGFRADPWDGVQPASFSNGTYMPLANGSGGGTSTDYFCGQMATFTTVTDRNGNTYNLGSDTDTLGRTPPAPPASSDTSDCDSPLPISGVGYYSYYGPNGSINRIKFCYSGFPVQTNFSETGVAQAQAAANPGLTQTTGMNLVATIVLPDHSRWTFNYDGYGEVIHLGMPLGGSIDYTWTEVPTLNCSGDLTWVSRAVATRTIHDNQGNSFPWTYQWGALQPDHTITNVVTDPLNNDTVHVFTDLGFSCNLYETSTREYAGSRATGQLLKQTDTGYSWANVPADESSYTGVGNVFATSIKTTIFPSGKVSLVQKTPDTGLGTNAPIFDNVITEKVYDYGPGAPGPLLRQTDTTYKWQLDNAYLNTDLLDLADTVTVKDGSGCTLAKTSYGYDEPGYLQTYTDPLPAGTHGAPPGLVRGNQTSTRRYLWNLASGSCAAAPAQPAIISHNAWYDTGELLQQTDPLGHTTTHSYHSAYAGAYSTQTCNALNQCVSGTYDLLTGLLTSFTDANAGTQQASGNTPGDQNHTSSYGYDFMWRLTSAQAPPDPFNGNQRAQSTFQYAAANTYPFTVQHQKPINDVSTISFDGLGRAYQTQHVTPSGTAKVDTSYDNLGRVSSVTNPYFNQTDATYGAVQTSYDALGRVTQTTKQDGSIATADYSDGNCTLSTDEAGKQRRACSDALGRLTSVDEPGDSSASASSIPAMGSQARGTVTITGADQSATGFGSGGTGGTVRCSPGVICDDSGGGGGGTTTIYDFGTVSITVNQRVYTASFSSPQDLPATIAAALAAAINADQSLGVTAASSAGTVSLTSVSASSAGSFTLTTSYTWDSTHFAQPSFTSTVTGIQGGTDGQVFGGHAYTTLYTYDALGNLLQVTQQGGTTTQSLWRVRNFSYDSLGRLLTSSNPESGTITYQYDNDGNLLSKTDARGLVTTYAYDPLHRLTGKSYSDNSPALIYVYDHLSWYANSNPIGRLVEIYNSANHAAVYDYDGMGRLVLQQESDGAGTSLGNTSAAYDLAGNLTSLTYPSGRKVTFNYNSANQLNQVQFTQWAGASVAPYTYWSASDANFSPMGSPNTWTLGNGVVESAVFNKRLQLQQETVTNSAIHTLMDHAFNYGPQGSNNGNVMSVADQLNPARTQSFTYDGLNRLLTANESRWGLGFVYDPWGNRLQQNVTSGSAGTSQLNVDNRNRIVGAPANCTAANAYCYDAAGDLLNDNFHQYTYDAESQIKQVDGGAAVYSYDANGQRVRKTTASGSTQYLYFGGNIIAEKNLTTGDWTDYIFANGKRIAQAFSNENRIRIYGSSTCTSCSGQWAYFAFPTTAGGLTNYVIKTGDKLFLRQTEIGTTQVGIGINFTDGTDTWGLTDQDGQAPSSDGLGLNGAWHSRGIDLSARQGKTVSMVYLYVTPTGIGNWSGYFNDIAIVSSDGSVYPLFSQNDTATFSAMDHSSGISTINYELNRDSTAATYPFSVHYYHGDQIGSSRLMTSAQGWPIWQGTFLPFGEEYNPQISSNHYKFTGMESDTESGLDDFGARYYGTSLGRFISPDPSMNSVRRSNPQTWNRYSYVLNSPLILVDPTGEVWVKSEDKDNPYTWQDKCGEGQTCYNQIATQVGESVKVYGPTSKTDTDTFSTNDNGYIDLSQVAKTDGAFFEFQTGVTNTFASPQTAVDLYNAAGEYHDEHPNDSKLSLNDVGSETGGHISPHQTHDLGRSVDMRYMDNDGKTTNNILKADDDRMNNLIGHFQDNGFNQIYSDNDRGYGTNWAPGHANHIHMGKTKGTAKCEIGSCR